MRATPASRSRHGRARHPPFGRGGTSNVRGSPARRLEPREEWARPAAEPGGGHGWLGTEARMWGGLARAARSDRRAADFLDPASRPDPKSWSARSADNAVARARPPCVLRVDTACRQPGSAAGRAHPSRDLNRRAGEPRTFEVPPLPKGGRRARPCCARRGRSPPVAQRRRQPPRVLGSWNGRRGLCRPSHAVTPSPHVPWPPGPAAKRPQAASATRPSMPPTPP
jgi:hypothetical protein